MLACGGVMFRAARNGRSVAHAARAMIAADNAQVRAAPPASRSGRAADSVARNPAVWTRPDPREIGTSRSPVTGPEATYIGGEQVPDLCWSCAISTVG